MHGVDGTADVADKAQAAASSARGKAEQGGEIVGRVVAAMSEIQASSGQIVQIVGVIEDVAFQTSLLALNAGVEAARAGEAGRGFAVVAQEVRGLAQRSAAAAKQIKTLMAASSSQVRHGVDLVTTSGRSLEEIVSEVGHVGAIVAGIAHGAREQATGLRKISGAADRMNTATRQTAVLMEETTVAAGTLAAETEDLGGIVAHFIVYDRPSVHQPSPRSAAPRPLPQSAMRPAAQRAVLAAPPRGPATRPSSPRPEAHVAETRQTRHSSAAARTVPVIEEEGWAEF
jgi:methyl-accepting chemotaxis protein